MPAALLVRILLWVWFAGAIAAGHWLLLQRLPPFGLQGIVLGLTALLLYGYFRVGALRSWIDELPLRAVVLLHLTRFVGFYFIALYQRGELPRAFAVPAGVGDIIVATFALPVAFAPLSDERRLRAIVIWNVVGLLDMLMVIFTATRLNLAEPGQMRAFTELPLSLLPTFLVPLILATHVIIFVRAARAPRPAAPSIRE